MDTGLTLINLANFTGKETIYYGRFVAEAIAQAEDLFELAIETDALPTDPLPLRLAQRGVLSMAEALYEGNKSRDLRFSPFKTETIGTYNYALAENSVLQGVPTGISWFDMAVARLRAGEPAIANSSVHAFDRPGDVVTVGTETYLPGPADSNTYKGSPLGRRDSIFSDWGWSGQSYVDDGDWPIP